MTVVRDFTIDFDEQLIAGVEGSSLSRVLMRPGGRETWEQALADARALVRPAAVWDFFPTEGISAGCVNLKGGARLQGGPIADVMAGAAEIAVGVCTVGEGISERVRELQKDRRLLVGLLLDELGSWAVDSVRQQVCRRLQVEAEGLGLRVSTSLSPGESAWGLQDQPVLFSLVDAGAIGVSLGESLVMRPLKSLSYVIGRGRTRLGHEGGQNCDFCALGDRCTYRCRREKLAERIRE
jgi:hypothetical protein